MVTGIGDIIEIAYKAACDKAVRRIKDLKMNPEWLKLVCVVSEQILSMSEFMEKIYLKWMNVKYIEHAEKYLLLIQN